MSKLYISLFGSIRLSYDEWVSDLFLPPMGQNLLAYLLLHRHTNHQRASLVGQFWGDQDEEKARKCLNSTLWRLRRVLEPGDPPRGTYLLSVSSEEIGFNRDSDFWLDVAAFEDNCTAGLARPPDEMLDEDVSRLRKATELYVGDLLDGNYNDWALRKREQLRNLYLACLRRLMQHYSRRQEYERSIEYGQRILHLDPLREDIHRALINAYVANDQRALALKQFDICCQTLATELQISPLEETLALYKSIAPKGLAISRNGAGREGTEPVLKQLGLAINNLEDACAQLQHAFQQLVQRDDPSRENPEKP